MFFIISELHTLVLGTQAKELEVFWGGQSQPKALSEHSVRQAELPRRGKKEIHDGR